MASPSTRLTIHQSPRISASMLARYITASVAGRASILQQAKYPPAELVLRYMPAKKVAAEYVVSGFANSVLAPAVQAQQSRYNAANTNWKRDDAHKCIGVINKMSAVLGQLPSACKYVRTSRKQPKLKIQGVEVSVNIDLDMTTQAKSAGGAIFVFSQVTSADVLGYMASLVEMRVAAGTNLYVDPNLCIALNCRTGMLVTAAQSQAKSSAISTACRLIATSWPSV